jgi:FMN phosphatase YigB (HAD superfamily)
MDACSNIKTLIFDLDGTLYGIENGYEVFCSPKLRSIPDSILNILIILNILS